MDTLFEVKEINKQDNYAKIVISPLKAGFGYTLGVALRRILLGALKGSAITEVEIKGVKHQFSSLKGMKEDVLDFLLNLKKVRFNNLGDEKAKATLSVSKQGEVKAKDIKTSSGVKVANPDLVLANLSKGAKLEAEMVIEQGIGYVQAAEREQKGIGTILLDASFSPVLKVDYQVEETRVGRVTNYDKLTLQITTDNTVSPLEALKMAAKILGEYAKQIVSPKEIVEDKKEESVDDLGLVGKLSVEEIGLPTRVSNALSKAGYDTVEKLVKAQKEELVKVRNLGEKSLKIIKAALSEKGVTFDKI